MMWFSDEHDQVSLVPANWKSRLSLTVLLIAAALYLFNVYRDHLNRWDDPYMNFRYAQHLAEGHGLTWNIGGERCEGFTSLLQVLLLSLGIRIGIRPESGSLVISVVSVFVTAGYMVRILQRQLGSVHPLAAVILGLYLVSETTAMHSVCGAETPLFVVLLCAGYYSALLFVDSPGWGVAVSMALFGFLPVLIRPEGILFGGALYGALLLYCLYPEPNGRDETKRLSRLGVSAGLLVLLGLLYAAWKYWYFGYLVPNSYYVKPNRLSLQGLAQVLLSLRVLAFWLAPLTIGSIFVLPGERFTAALREARKRTKVMLTLGPAFLALVYYATINEPFPSRERFAYPAYFFLIAAAAVFVSVATGSTRATKTHFLKFVLATTLCFSILIGYVHGWSLEPQSDIGQYYFKVAQTLRGTGLGARGSVMCDAAGIIPYISGFTHVDPVGLTDNALSGRRSLSPSEREQYLWSRRTDVYLGYEPPALAGAQGPTDDPRMGTPYVARCLLGRKLTGVSDRIFLQDPELLYFRMKELRDRWYWVGEVPWAGWQMWRLKSFVYVRKDSPSFDVLVSSLKRIVAIEPDRVDLMLSTKSTKQAEDNVD